LTENDTYEASPVWSPDGKQIAFLSRRGSGHFQIYVMDMADGSETQLTDLPETVHSPAWSPDGAYMAFIREGSAGSQINVIDLESGKVYLVHADFNKYAGLAWIE
jgi:Tol biopolymer transport system component